MSIKILGIIPARYESTRLPGKLLLPIFGKTLIQRTFENACQSKVLDKLLIATDDERIFKHVKEFGGHPIMTSLDCPTGTDRLAEVLHKDPQWQQVQAVVNIQGDEPCVDVQAIDQAVKLLMDDPIASMATLITPLNNKEEALSSSIVKCIKDTNNNALYFSRNLIPSNKKHGFNPLANYYRHIGLYVYRPEFLLHYQKLPSTPLQLEEDLEQLKILEHGYRIKVAMTNHESIGIDIPEDIQKLEKWLCKQNIFS